jgi:hypothetical protein
MEAIPGSRLWVRRIHAVSDRALAAEICLSQSGADTSSDSFFHNVGHIGPFGFDRNESFGPDALDEALACYHRPSGPVIESLTNRCIQMALRAADSFASRDWNTYEATMSDGLVYEDHRTIMKTPAAGGREAVAGMRTMAKEGADRLEITPLAMRGDHHVLLRTCFRSSADPEAYFSSAELSVVSSADDGRHDRTSIYDLDHEDRAVADLERRYIEGEGAPYAEILTLFAEGTRALNQRDWDHFQACFSPRAAHVDHYSAGWDSRRGGADILAAFVDFAGSLPGARTIVREIHACTTDSLLATTVVSGQSEDGGAVEFVFHLLGHRAGRVLDHTESFSSDALDDALAAYGRLTANATPETGVRGCSAGGPNGSPPGTGMVSPPS